MGSKLGKIVLCDNKSNPVVIISENDKVLKGLEIVQKHHDCVSSNANASFKLSNNDFVKIKYKGRRLNSSIIDFGNNRIIKNLDVREIAYIKEDTYYKLLRKYVSYYAFMGATAPCYLSVRDDVHNQLIKLMNKQ